MKKLHLTLAALTLGAAALFAATTTTPAPSPGTGAETPTAAPAPAAHAAHEMSCHASGKAAAAPTESKGHCKAMKKTQAGGGCCP